MTLTIELRAETERLLRDEAERRGRSPADLAGELVHTQLESERRRRAQRITALMDQWNAEDAADPDPQPVWDIPRLALREIASD